MVNRRLVKRGYDVVLRILATALALASAAPASAQFLPYDELFVFGDSLVDTGNAQIGAAMLGLDDPAPAALGYFAGRFSNGPNFADDLSGLLGDGLSEPYLAMTGGTIFAFGGAQAREQAGDLSPSFIEQLGLFAGSGQTIGGDDLVLVTLGGNDIRSVVRDTGPVDFTDTLEAMRDGLLALIGAGARTIVVTGLPDIGRLPATRLVALNEMDPAIIPVATARSEYLNEQFALLAGTLNAVTNADVRFFDLLAFQRDLEANPAAFGLPADLDTTSFCQAGGPPAVLGGCEGYLYFDPVHPTAQVHEVIAAAIADRVAVTPVPEPATWAFLIAGAALTGGALRRVSRAPVRRGTAAA